MIEHYEKFRLLDENKQNEFYAEVNWDSEDKKSNQCKLIRFIFPDGKTAVVKKDLLNSLLFTIGTEDEQRNMIPQTLETVHQYQTVLGVKATKNIGKGEMLNFPVNLSIPCATLRHDIIGNVPKPKKKWFGK
jgi:hypothetical protein